MAEVRAQAGAPRTEAPCAGGRRATTAETNESMTERVLAALRAQIISGERRAGSPLVERDLADEFEVSRRPIRSAMRRLRLEGVAEEPQYRRLVVSPVTRADVADIGEILGVLDPYAAELAAERRTAADLAAHEAALAGCELAMRGGDTAGVIRHALDLRACTILASRSRPLIDLQQLLDTQVRRVFALGEVDLAAHVGFCRDIVRAVRAGDAAAAADAVRTALASPRIAHQGLVARQLELGEFDAPRSRFLADPPRAHAGAVSGASTDVALIADALRDQIMTGLRRPDSEIAERAIAEQFDVDRVSARQVIERLALEGLVALHGARDAATVRALDADEAEAVYDVCLRLDALAVSRAAQRRSRDDLECLHALLRRQLETDPSRRRDRLARMWDFRVRIVDVAGNQWLHRIAPVLESRMRLAGSELRMTPETTHAHELVYEAIASRDSALGSRIVHEVFGRPEYRGAYRAAEASLL